MYIMYDVNIYYKYKVAFALLRSFYCHYANYMCILPGVMQDICLCIAHYTLYSVHYTLYSIQCTLYTVQCTLYTIQYTVYTIHCTVYTIHGTVYTIHYTVYSVHYTLYSVHYTLYSVHYTRYIVYCTDYCTLYVYTIKCTLLTIPYLVRTSIFREKCVKCFNIFCALKCS